MTWKSIGLFLFSCQISVQSLMSTYSWEGLNLAIKLKKWTCIHTYICTEAMLYLPCNKLHEGILNLYYVFKRNNKKNCPKFYNMILHFFSCMAAGLLFMCMRNSSTFSPFVMASSWYVWVKKKPESYVYGWGSLFLLPLPSMYLE